MSINDPLTPEKEAELDDITDSTVKHPVGIGIGATSGILAGAAAGMAGGPVGMAVGAAVGAVAGGALGNATAATISPTEEERYWSEHHATQEYAELEDFTYEDYQPAYRMGYEGPTRYQSSFEAAEDELQKEWEASKGNSRLDWPRARKAARAGWDRVRQRSKAGMPPQPI